MLLTPAFRFQFQTPLTIPPLHPAGTGKTLLARAAAAECGASFLSISPSSILSKWVGDGVRNVRALFSLAAKLSPCVVFVDEVRLTAQKSVSQSALLPVLLKYCDIADTGRVDLRVIGAWCSWTR